MRFHRFRKPALFGTWGSAFVGLAALAIPIAAIHGDFIDPNLISHNSRDELVFHYWEISVILHSIMLLGAAVIGIVGSGLVHNNPRAGGYAMFGAGVFALLSIVSPIVEGPLAILFPVLLCVPFFVGGVLTFRHVRF